MVRTIQVGGMWFVGAQLGSSKPSMTPPSQVAMFACAVDSKACLPFSSHEIRPSAGLHAVHPGSAAAAASSTASWRRNQGR